MCPSIAASLKDFLFNILSVLMPTCMNRHEPHALKYTATVTVSAGLEKSTQRTVHLCRLWKGAAALLRDLPLLHKYPAYTAVHKYWDRVFWLYKSVDWMWSGKKITMRLKCWHYFVYTVILAQRDLHCSQDMFLCTFFKGPFKPAVTDLFGHLGAVEISCKHTKTAILLPFKLILQIKLQPVADMCALYLW